MNSELTQRLVKRFPVLYQDYHSPMTQTCMCWGFDHGDGWFEIIWQLSLAIEEELGYSWLQKRWFLVKKGFPAGGTEPFISCPPFRTTSENRKARARRKTRTGGWSSRKLRVIA